MFYETKEEYIKAYQKQYDCLYEQLKKAGYDIDKQISKEESNLYNNEYKIIKSHWNSFPNEDFSKVIYGKVRNEINKNDCISLLNKKSNLKYLGYEVSSYDSIIEYYFDDKENTLYIYLYHYDVYKPTSKTYKRHKRYLEVVFESKAKGNAN